MQFAMSGPQRLDVDTLNEQLKAKGANRLRYTMYPDEAFGMLFRWENVVADTHGLQLRAWRRLAEEAELPWPHSERDMYDLIPERVIMEVHLLLHLSANHHEPLRTLFVPFLS